LTDRIYQIYFIRRQEEVTMYRADLINTAMEEQGKTNESLAHAAGLSHATISAIRNGEENLRLLSLKKTANALNLRVEIRFIPETEAQTAAG
jgi:transcriptional regulator with XRE-family HTH domain